MEKVGVREERKGSEGERREEKGRGSKVGFCLMKERKGKGREGDGMGWDGLSLDEGREGRKGKGGKRGRGKEGKGCRKKLRREIR